MQTYPGTELNPAQFLIDGGRPSQGDRLTVGGRVWRIVDPPSPMSSHACNALLEVMGGPQDGLQRYTTLRHRPEA